MALIFLGVIIVFNVSSFQFHQVKLPRLHCQWWVVPNSSDHWIIRFGGRLGSYYKLQPKLKQFLSLQMHFSWFELPCRRKPLSTLWKTTYRKRLQACVSANGGNNNVTIHINRCYLCHLMWLFLRNSHEFSNKRNWILKIWGFHQ